MKNKDIDFILELNYFKNFESYISKNEYACYVNNL